MVKDQPKLYIICGSVGGGNGDGGLYEVDPSPNTPSREIHSSSWRNATCMVGLDEFLYIICGRMGGGNGDGGLYCVSPDGACVTLNNIGSWTNATCMAALEGKLYIICGAVKGCNGGGGLYEVNLALGSCLLLNMLHSYLVTVFECVRFMSGLH